MNGVSFRLIQPAQTKRQIVIEKIAAPLHAHGHCVAVAAHDSFGADPRIR